MVIVTVSLESEGETEMLDIMLSQKREYKLFCTGTIASIARICGIACSRCHENFPQPPVAEINGELFVMFALESKAETFELLCSLTETGLTKVQTSANIISFLNSKQPVCTACKQREEEEHIISRSSTHNSTLTSLFNAERKLDAAPADEDAVSENNSRERTLQASQTVVHRLLQDLAAFSATNSLAVQSQPISLDEVKPLDVHRIAAEHKASAVNTRRDKNNNNVELVTENKPRVEHQCQACGRNFATGLQQHARIHVSRLPFKCRTCDHECRYRQQMESHFKSRHVREKLTYIDMSSHADYLKEVNVKTRECFPDWISPQNRPSRGRGRGRPRKNRIS